MQWPTSLEISRLSGMLDCGRRILEVLPPWCYGCRMPDDEFVYSIAPDVMKCLMRSGYFEKLDDPLSLEDSLESPWIRVPVRRLCNPGSLASPISTKSTNSELKKKALLPEQQGFDLSRRTRRLASVRTG